MNRLYSTSIMSAGCVGGGVEGMAAIPDRVVIGALGKASRGELPQIEDNGNNDRITQNYRWRSSRSDDRYAARARGCC